MMGERRYRLKMMGVFVGVLGIGVMGVWGDWLGFRGPNGGGVALEAVEGMPVKLDGEVAWDVALPGRGLSSPVIVGDRVFVTAASGPQQEELHVLCFDAGDGAKLWERRFWASGRTMSHKKTCVAAPTPVSDGERVYALFSSNDLVCLDLEGNLVWLRGLMVDYPNASNSLGLATSPVIAGDTLVVQIENDSDSFAAGIDLATGENKWRTARTKKANWSSPVVMREGESGEERVVLQGSQGVTAVHPDTGVVEWVFEEGAATIPSSGVGASGEVIYVPSNGLAALQRGPEGNTAQTIWQASELRPGTASPIEKDGKVYIVNNLGVLTCADAATGERLWRVRLKGPFSGSPVAAGDHLYFFNERGIGQVVDLSGEEGAVVGEVELGETILGTAAIADGGVFVRSDGRLWRFGD
ncbi:MAG: PQQ-binding-like beta-propeller repeat protein [Verrucomicrobiota bacterium]